MQTSASGQKKLSYSPVNDAHSIVEVVVFVQFNPVFSQATIKKLISVEHDLKDDLPKSNPLKRVTFQLDQEKQSSATQDELIVGIELQSIRKDGSLDWMLRTTEDTISIHCLDYTSWDDVWGQAEGYLKKVFGYIEGSDSFISSIGLKCIDRFLYEGEPDRSDLSELFRPETSHIVKTAFTCGLLWHCHSGWFDNLNNLQCLNQLNIDANFINIRGNRVLAISVDHNAIAIMENDDTLSTVLEQNGNQMTMLSEIMNALHLKNKHLLIELLSEQMANRINLSLPTEE